MTRIARVVLPGYPHHITQRGVRSMPVFFTDDDRDEYLRLQREQGERFGVKFISYCLMTNHVHLVAIPEDETGLARAIGEAHRLYTRRINFREKVRGYLFQGRFFSCPLDGSYLISAVRYVERNPVRAKMVKHAWEYEWSSAAYHVGIKNEDVLVTDSDLLKEIDDWRLYLSGNDKDIEELRLNTRTGRPAGGEGFIAKAERIVSRVLHPGKAGRPKKN
ncbi:MAG: transposase [Proteobacteria bacterium]|nr:transposase [Pseudomonadota bacterium]MBU1739534.1 transposase [Pseudomonadota bacterium]